MPTAVSTVGSQVEWTCRLEQSSPASPRLASPRPAESQLVLQTWEDETKSLLFEATEIWG